MLASLAGWLVWLADWLPLHAPPSQRGQPEAAQPGQPGRPAKPARLVIQPGQPVRLASQASQPARLASTAPAPTFFQVSNSLSSSNDSEGPQTSFLINVSGFGGGACKMRVFHSLVVNGQSPSQFCDSWVGLSTLCRTRGKGGQWQTWRGGWIQDRDHGSMGHLAVRHERGHVPDPTLDTRSRR